MQYYAHSKENEPPENWQPLEEHLKNVAKLAAEFAKPFGGQDWAYLAGLWHDVGKGTPSWQAYLRHVNHVIDESEPHYRGRIEHAIHGAQRMHVSGAPSGRLLSYCIAGHHGGLPNWDGSLVAGLKSRLEAAHDSPAVALQEPQFPTTPPWQHDPKRCGFQLQFFTRMLFSCLVDADFLDTEKVMSTDNAQWRSQHPLLAQVRQEFWTRFEELRRHADPELPVNQQRECVLQNCLAKAADSPGIFSLTVPTGGGKTLASLAFALEHAAKYRKDRIIYVIPFTSIIEQNADVFRQMVGEDSVLEHHCTFMPDESDWMTRLATENWDAPLIVTTNVQFFDCFYGNRSSKCRKLHNVANSVVIFDEVQAIPVEKIKPCLEVIRELSLGYGVTSVLCTATQPAFDYSAEFESGLQGVTEIVSDVPALFSALKRTQEVYVGERTVEQLASQLAEPDQVLCVVNTRGQAQKVHGALSDKSGTFHLSALMYPMHRRRVLAEIRRRLEDGLPCRVISTQLIEAGVDIDFPVVYRAAAGIDSIAQAAGRCNRNGRSKHPRQVFVFRFPESDEGHFMRQAAQSAAKLFSRYSGNLTAPECVREYFTDYFWKNEQRMDADNIVSRCMQAFRGEVQFADIAEFQMINSATMPIVIALEDEAAALVDALEYAEHKGRILRQLQQFTVQVYPYQLEELQDWCENPQPGVWVLRTDQIYSETKGLDCKPPEGNAFFG